MLKRLVSKMSNVLETRILKVDPASIHFGEDAHLNGSLPTIADPVSEKNLLEAAKIIRGNSEPVAFPTETVYGLGGSSLSDEAVKSIYRAKNRPSDNPLITHVSSIDQLNRKIYQEKLSSPFQNIPKPYHSLITKLWPGPLTILLPVPPAERSALSKLTTADQPTFAVRIPSNPIARALIALSDTPIAAPSANASTRPSPTMASHVYHDLNGRIPLILDGGPCKVGVESTVVDGLSKPPLLLRPGGFTYEEILELGGQDWKDCKVERRKVVAEGEQVKTPGMKYKHYSPSAKVILLVPKPQKTDSDRIEELKRLISRELQNEDTNTVKKLAILTSLHLGTAEIQDLTLGDSKIKPILVKLGNTGEEIQANLFAALRQVDEIDNVDIIFVEGINEDREGLAIMNRLRKAAGDHCVSF
ncbi:hypothetical protein ZYGR_0AL01130 [Zygosaccharomyces rouxii]|uniref:Threonylcarbamoyl-AMP synthase n=1 Tax=Zygosaccharomyces rouxii TaxID=4956 RepID=A0A1Q3AFD4_ZYGRO|nr:hypothetical protein ZYGR_0AL01130 [Zygosaccharomyces rouxii]